MLKKLLQSAKADKEQKVFNRERLMEKLDLCMKQLPDSGARVLSEEQLAALSQVCVKKGTSVLYYLFRFGGAFDMVMPTFVQLVSANKKDRALFSRLITYPEKKEEETTLYKRLLEIEREEHRRDVEALYAGLTQAETEIQLLKSERTNQDCIAASLKHVR